MNYLPDPPSAPPIWQPGLIDYPISNHTSRSADPDGVVFHSMGQHIGGQFEGMFAADFLDHIGLSAHYLIDHMGTIYYCVDPTRQAYHAGVSRFRGETGLNRTFIGIELLIEGEWEYGGFLQAIKDPDSFTDKHYQSLLWLCKNIIEDFEVPTHRFVEHSRVSGADVRPNDPKYDPGDGFKYQYVLSKIEGIQDEISTGRNI